MSINSIIESRKSVRDFKKKKPDWRDIIEAIDSARFAPCAGNNFTLKFLIVKNKEKIQGIANASEQSFIATTDYVVVIYSDPSRLINLFSERGKRYSRQQAGAAIENFWLSLIDKGLSTCWVGHFDDDMIKKLLKIPNKMELEAVFPIGYDSGKTKRRKRLDLDRILYFDSHGNKKMKTPYNPEA
ncbi:MAG: nitroreductase family protein [Candidatus Nanoarchaeia archaeon]